jgi:serine/threonine-protein kinase
VAAIGIVAAIVLCSPSGSVPPGPGARTVDPGAQSGHRPTDAQIEQAVAAGSDAIERLLVELPGNPRLLKALARSYMEANRADKALGAYRSLAAVDPTVLEDREDRANMVLLCKVESTSDAAFAMLESDMGSRGVDLLYWLAYESDAGRPYRARAEYALDKRTVRARADPALAIALDLQAAATCEQKHALLERARVDGDRRARKLLMALRTSHGCGFLQLGECWTCLRRDSQLDDAIRAIEERSAAPADAAAPSPTG